MRIKRIDERSAGVQRELRWRLMGCLIGAVLSATGCAELEPMGEPETADLQMMVSSLQAAAREHDRTLTEVRAELEGRRQELGAAVVAKAHLEGRLREVERRLNEARHIIDLQREELVFSRAERERALQSRFRTQPKIRPAQKPALFLPREEAAQNGGGTAALPASPPPVPSPAPVEGQETLPMLQSVPAPVMENSSITPQSAVQQDLHTVVASDEPADPSMVGTLLRTVAVKAGDTLYSLARRYGVNLGDLRATNGLRDDRILVGQALTLPPPRDRRDR